MKPVNILLVVLDATRVDACSCYNPGQPRTPALDELADSGLRFERAFASAPWTLPALSSILTGLYPTQTDVESRRVLAPAHRTLATRLKERGYTTFAISKNSWFSTEFGLPQGFDTFHKLWQIFQTETDLTEVNLAQAYPGENLLVSAARGALRGNLFKNAANLVSRRIRGLNDSDYGAQRTLRPVQQWISAQTGPWFALVHYLEAHLEYKPPVEWARRYTDNWPLAQKLLAADQLRLCYRHITGAERLTADELHTWRQLYAAEVAYQDAAMGQLLHWLQQSGRADNTLVIAVADHGESQGEQGLLSHLYSLHDPLIHVPLILRGPGVPRGRSTRHLVQSQDIFGTVLAAAGMPLPAGARNLLDDSSSRSYVVAEYAQPRMPRQELLDRFQLSPSHFTPFLRNLTAVRTQEHKLVTSADGTLALYDLIQDPEEQIDRSLEQPALLATLQGKLAEWRASVGLALPPAAAAPAIAPEVAARLKALGYLD